MVGKVVLSVGMPRGGSGWYFNLTHDMVLAAGGQDARQIRARYGLNSILTEINCNIGSLSSGRLLRVLVPTLLGNTFTIKTHAGPKRLSRALIRWGFIKPAYIYRDPRDALLSAFEYGQRSRGRSRDNVFAKLSTIEEAVTFIRGYVRISEDWLATSDVLHTRYEDFVTNYDVESARLAGFLGLDKSDRKIQEVIEKYRPERGREGQKGLHLAKGKIGRFRESLDPDMQALCIQLFGNYLQRAGYSP